ncbi:response regulator transcription factor [Oxalobacteraceae bacterium A2-2]
MNLQSKLLLDIYNCATDANAAELNDYVLNRIKSVIAFDSGTIADLEYSEEHGFMISGLYLHKAPVEKFLQRREVMGVEKLDTEGRLQSLDIVYQAAFANRGRSVRADLTALRFQTDIEKYIKRYDTAQSLVFVSPHTSSPKATTVALWRAGKRRAYDDVHVNLADNLLPHVLKARQINQQLKLTALDQRADTTIAFSDYHGCVQFIEPAAVQMLQREWSNWEPPVLPAVLMERLGAGNPAVYAGTAVQVRAVRQEDILCLLVSLRQPPSATLTSAEMQVSSLAVQGMQNKEIARALGTSPATVRNQLHAVYRKLGVASRHGLIAAMHGRGWV